ncbi:MAG: FAD-binding oxidoreductase [Gordonia sp. (in: high G+C Gram-positive bacteria)]|uniref:FAD-binding oxidoreductase n=1 Tax=Gordonia sp. (in: high G+C Gram-positive bacteria) TaxID=84139 RepID=UPI0039E620C5
MSNAHTPPNLADLRGRVRGAVHGPTDPGYPAVGFNVAVDRRPAAVVDVADAADVAASVAFAATHGLTVAVFATGHGGTPVGPTTILLRTTDLDSCVVDAESRTARVGAGVRWQTVIDAAAPHGLAALCGSAPSVGVAGYISGGGIGPLVRTVGSSADHVREITVVTGDAAVRTVSATENPELFWGLRGGKATLGIITEVVLDLPEIAEFFGGAVYFDGGDAAAVLRAWREWSAGLPDEASTSVALLNLPPLPDVPPMLAGKLTVAVRYACLADPESAAEWFAPMRAAASPLLDAVGPMPYAAIGAVHADPPGPMPATEHGGLLAALPDEAIDILHGLATSPAAPLLPVVEVRQLGGAFAREPEVRSALCHRDAAFNLNMVGILADEEAAGAVLGAIGSSYEALGPWLTGGVLPNFVATDDRARIRDCYDDDTAAWLSALADQLDPKGVYRVGQVMRG